MLCYSSTQDFPWYFKPVEELIVYSAFVIINEQPALIWLTGESLCSTYPGRFTPALSCCADGTEEESKKALDVLNPIATKYLDENKDKDKDKQLVFMYSGPNTDSMGGSLSDDFRHYAKLPWKTPILSVIDVPKRKYVYEESITADIIECIVEEFKAKQLDWVSL